MIRAIKADSKIKGILHEASSRDHADRIAVKVSTKHPAALYVDIWELGTLVGFCINVEGKPRLVDIGSGTIDGEPGFLLSFFGAGNTVREMPDLFAIAPDAESAIEVAKRLLHWDGLNTNATVAISTAKKVEPYAPLAQAQPDGDGHMPLRYSVQVERSGQIVVIDHVEQYKERRIKELTQELADLGKFDGTSLA